MSTIVVILVIVIIFLLSSSNTRVDDSKGPIPGVMYKISPQDKKVMCREDIFDGDSKVFTKGQVYITAQDRTVYDAHLVVIDNFGVAIFFDWHNTHFVAVG